MSEFPERVEYSDVSDDGLIAEIEAMTLQMQLMRSIGLIAEARIVQAEIKPRSEELIGRRSRKAQWRAKRNQASDLNSTV